MVVAVTLSETTRLLASRGKATSFSVLVDSFDDPVDSGIPSNSLVRRINKDNLEVFVC